VRVTWKTTYSIDLVATPGAMGQSAYSSMEIYVFAYVYDMTNGSYHYTTYEGSSTHSISSGSLSKTYRSISVSSWDNGTYATGHVYALFVYFEATVYAGASAGTSSSSGSVNAGTSGHKATLESVRIS